MVGCLFLAVPGSCCCLGFSLVALSRDYSLLVCRLLIAAAPLIAEDRPQGARASVDVAQGLSSCSPQALEQANLLHSMWDLPGPGVEPVSPALAGRFFTTELPGKPPFSKTEAVNLGEVKFITSFLVRIVSKNSLSNPRSWTFSPIFFLEVSSFQLFHLVRSMNYFETTQILLDWNWASDLLLPTLTCFSYKTLAVSEALPPISLLGSLWSL